MAINFPVSLDNFTNPVSTDTTTAVDHAVQHSNVNDAVEALEAKVGVNSSAVTTSHDYKLGEVTSTDKAVGKTATQTLTNKTLTSPVINTPTGIVKGDVGLGNVDNTSDSTKNSATATLTNKRVTPRSGTTTSSATPTINTDNVDFYYITAQSGNITSMTTNLSGTPTEGQTLWLAMTATSGTPTITWGTGWEASSIALPTGLTTTRQDFKFVWNTTTSKWRFVGYA